MSDVKITFGTAGWRGIISDDFTFANVRLVSQAIADYLATNGQRVCHLIDRGSAREHCVNQALRLIGETLRYDRNSQASLEF